MPAENGRGWRSLGWVFRAAQVRLRFLAALAVAFVIVAGWDVIRTYWDRWTSPMARDASMGAVSADKPVAEDTLSAAVERNLTRYFAGFENSLPPPGLYHRILREIEYPLLSAALAATRGNQIRAADLLGLNRNTLRKKIRDLDIQVIRTSG